VGAIGVEAFPFACLNNQPNGRDMLGILDAARILEFLNFILVEPSLGGKGHLVAWVSLLPPLGSKAWLNCIIFDAIVVVSI
jgi:hypothetical protein